MTFTKGAISFERVSKVIEDNGGRIAELDDAKLTHVVLDKRDDSRRRELMKRTSKYGHTHLHYFSLILRSSPAYIGQSTEIWFSPTSSRRA
jgi:DNA ligase-4